MGLGVGFCGREAKKKKTSPGCLTVEFGLNRIGSHTADASAVSSPASDATKNRFVDTAGRAEAHKRVSRRNATVIVDGSSALFFGNSVAK